MGVSILRMCGGRNSAAVYCAHLAMLWTKAYNYITVMFCRNIYIIVTFNLLFVTSKTGGVDSLALYACMQRIWVYDVAQDQKCIHELFI